MRKILYYITFIVIVLTIALSLLSLIRDTDWRYLKMLDFARIQIFIVGLIGLFFFVIITKIWRWYDYTMIIFLVIALACQVSYLINYTSIVNHTVPDSSETQFDLSVLIFNVYLENDQYNSAISMINESDADIVLSLEVTEKWDKKLEPLKDKYSHYTKTVNDVGYGMTVYSKYELENLEQYYLHNDKVPSYGFQLSLPNEKVCKMYTVHPPPPTYFEEMPDNEGQKEKELKILGAKIKDEELPVIMLGDLNDVAWGKTERLVKAGGKLNDIRVGRGMYNSFSAHSYLMRWPLDHIFVTKEFSLVDLKLLDNCGSDHFPVYAELTLN